MLPMVADVREIRETRDLIAIYWDADADKYVYDLLDQGAGTSDAANARIGQLTQDLNEEQQVSARAMSQIELLNQQIAAMRRQLAALEEALAASENRDRESQARIADLGSRLNVALAQKVQELAGAPLLFQELISESYGHDTRINVVGGRVVASMLRRSTDGDFRSNLTRGGAMENYTPTPEEAAQAIRAAELLGLEFAGVDVLFGKNGPILCEVNSNAHFKTTLQCTGVNMAVEIMRHIAGKLAEQ